MKVDTGYLYARDNKRIFVNTCLGCTGQCLYCYLPKYGYDNNLGNQTIKTAESLIEEIEGLGVGSDTLITLGCFSECFDEKNKPETLKLIKYFLARGNQVQVATKRQVKLDDVQDINDLIQYQGQFVIFISSATISKWGKYEKGTDLPEQRFKSFDISKSTDIPTVLYMKPVLKGVTKNDIDLYKEVINRYGVKNVVVGSVFGENKSNETVHFSDDERLFYNPNEDELEISKQLMGLGNVRVFSRSSTVMNFYRKKELERE